MLRPRLNVVSEKNIFTIGVLAFIALACAVRIYNSFNVVPFGDENGTYFWVSHTGKEILYRSGTWLTMHWYILAVKGLDWVGFSHNHLRILSLLFAAAGWWFCYITIRTRCSPILAVAGVSLVTIIPSCLGRGDAIGYDVMIRSYSLVFMLICMCACLWERWCSKKKFHFLTCFSLLAATACVLSLPSGLFFIAAIPILILTHYHYRPENEKYLHVLKKDALAVSAAGIIAGIYCYLAQVTFLESMLARHSRYISTGTSGLSHALETLQNFYLDSLTLYGLVFVCSLCVILFYRRWDVFAAVLLCFLIFAGLIEILGIDHKPWAIGRIFYRYFHLIVVGTIVFALHLISKRLPRTGLVLAGVIIGYGCYFAVSRARAPLDTGLKELFESYEQDSSIESKDAPLFVVDYPKQHWISSLTERKELIADAHKGIDLLRLASKPEIIGRRPIIVLTRLCDKPAARQAGQYCSYEYRAVAAQSALQALVADIESRFGMDNKIPDKGYISHAVRRQTFVESCGKQAR